MTTQFEEPFFPEQVRDILERLVVFTGHGPIRPADREQVDKAITKIIEAHAAADLGEQKKLLERIRRKWLDMLNNGDFFNWLDDELANIATRREGGRISRHSYKTERPTPGYVFVKSPNEHLNDTNPETNPND